MKSPQEWVYLVYHYGEYFGDFITIEEVAKATGMKAESARWQTTPLAHRRSNSRKAEAKWTIDKIKKDEWDEE
jgi:hypothetical protein